MAKISAKAGSRSVPTPPQRASFVLGSRPSQLRANPVPRIKPQFGVTQYGKSPAGGGGPGNPAGASAGDTGQTDFS
jgi:hypothetical protein